MIRTTSPTRRPRSRRRFLFATRNQRASHRVRTSRAPSCNLRLCPLFRPRRRSFRFHFLPTRLVKKACSERSRIVWRSIPSTPSPPRFSCSRFCIRSRQRRLPPGPTECSRAMTSGAAAATSCRRRASRPRCFTFSARSRSSSVCGRSSCSRRWHLDALGHGHGITSTTPSTTPEPLFVVVIMALASTRPIIVLCGSRDAPRRRAGGRDAGGLVARHPDRSAPLLGSFITEPAAMTICALLLARQFYDLQPRPATEVRDARPAVRQRLDWRHLDALRRASGADGRAPVGMGHAVHARRTSAGGRVLAIVVANVGRTSRSSARSSPRSSRDAAGAGRRSAGGERHEPARHRAAAGAGVAGRRPCACSWRGRSSTLTIRRCFSAAS